MAATRNGPGMPVLALKRPQHEVELFNFSLNNDCLLVFSESTSKSFICFQIINEFLQSHQSENRKWAVILSDDSSGLNTDSLAKMLDRLLPGKSVVFPSLNEIAKQMTQENKNVLLTSPNHLHYYIKMGYLHANTLSVVIHLTTLASHNINTGHIVLKSLQKVDAKPRIIGLMQLNLNSITTAVDLKSKLDHAETTYDLPVYISKDLLAMNAFGEETPVKIAPYTQENLNPTEKAVCKKLMEVLDFFNDINMPEILKSIQNVKAVIAWSVEVLTVFDLWSLSFMLNCIQNTLSNMLNNQNHPFVILAIEACKTNFDFVHTLVNNQRKDEAIHSRLLYTILDELAPYQAYCNTPAATNSEQDIDEDIPSEEQRSATDIRTEQDCRSQEDNFVEEQSILCGSEDGTEGRCEEKSQRKVSMKNTSSKQAEVVEKRVQKMKEKSRFHCMIVTRSNSFARLLSKLINFMSSCNEKYSLLKSGCVVRSKHASVEDEERTENVLQAVLQGTVNILVTTMELFSDLSLTTFNVLVYFGVPESGYQEYYQIKNKIKGLGSKLMLVFHENHLVRCESALKAFNDIETEIAKRVSDYISRENKERWLTCLGKDVRSNYMPFGEDGPLLPMESCIHVINRYCRWITRGDFCNLYAQFNTKKKAATQNCIESLEIISKLYLPLGCYCCSIIEGPPVKVSKGDELEVGILKSRMLVSLECVKRLHSKGKMDDDLDLIEEMYVDANLETLQNFEVEDEGRGRAGTNKRKRAYQIKVPTFFENNMPRANEPSFLYKIHFDDPIIYKHSKSGSLQSLSEPEFDLGFLSRKPLPKIPSFSIHTSKSDVEVSLEANDKTENCIGIDETTLRYIRLFHHYVFKELHKLDSQSTKLSDTDGCLAVPLISSSSTTSRSCNDRYQIHIKFLQEFSSCFESTTSPEVVLKSAPPRRDFSFFQNKIVRRLNQSANQTHYARYFVVRVCDDLSPKSPFPDQNVASTFVEYYLNRYGIEVKLEQPLLLVQHLPTQVNFIIPRNRLQDAKTAAEEGNTSTTLKGSRTEIHLIPELCSILPLSASAWSLARYLPAVVYRLETLLRAHEMKERIEVECWRTFRRNVSDGVQSVEQDERAKSLGTRFKNELLEVNRLDERDCAVARRLEDGVSDGGYCVHDCNVCSCSVSSASDVGDCGGFCHDDIRQSGNDHNDDDVIYETDAGPNLSLILHALTAKSTGQQYHSEQLEVLGDSCLKFEVSLELYLSDPEKDEWTLSIYRNNLVSNDMLSTQGRRLGLPGYISITPPDLSNTTRPPGIILQPSPVVNVVKKATFNSYTHHVLGDKHVANCVEALIAATLVSCGRDAARQFLIWLGITKYTVSELTVLYERLFANTSENNASCMENDLHKKNCVEEIPPNNDHHSTTTRSIPNFDHIEKELGYSFKNRLLLLQALTHNTYPRSLSLVSETYQKMEFLGDAILDYLVTRYLFENFPQLNHGDVTDFRSALVNNFSLAFLAVQTNLHQSLRYMSPPLFNVIGQFLEFLEEQELKQGASWKTSVDAFVVGNPEEEEGSVEVPKVLGDVFEAVVCAVFLDCGMDLERVWLLFYPMFFPFIDYYKDNIPRSPVRVLKESFPDSEQVLFSLARLTLSRKYKSSVHVFGYGKFEAIGRTPKIAKAIAARKALQHIRNTKV